MHKTVAEAEEFIAAFLPQIFGEDHAEVVLCAPYTALTPLVDSTRGSRVKVAAQNMHFEQSGAFTGEVSAPMLAELEVGAVVIGHSERREFFGETDAALAHKVPAALSAGIEPILCVGESDAQREAGETESVLERQIEADLAQLPSGRLGDVVVAYEPIWAIGTGKVATTEQAQEACAHIRSLLARIDGEGAVTTRILYGGSVKPDNVAELLAQSDIDGALVGGASLDAAGFAKIVAAGDKA
jgi:triosephosphate isomerase